MLYWQKINMPMHAQNTVILSLRMILSGITYTQTFLNLPKLSENFRTLVKLCFIVMKFLFLTWSASQETQVLVFGAICRAICLQYAVYELQHFWQSLKTFDILVYRYFFGDRLIFNLCRCIRHLCPGTSTSGWNPNNIAALHQCGFFGFWNRTLHA